MFGKRLSRALLVTVAAFLVVVAGAMAAELITAELVGTTNDVTVQQGHSANFVINVSATGNVACGTTHSATVKTSYAISSAGVVSSSTPSGALNFTGPAGDGNCPITWSGAPAAMTISASVSANASTPVGTYTILLSEAAGTTSTTDSNTTGGKLDDSTATSITVHVTAGVTDTDGDGIADGQDNCPTAANATQADADGDGIGDVCDSDLDGDGVANTSDNCPAVSNANQVDVDNDGVGDVCDDLIDNDGDGVANDSDNCPTVANAAQTDIDTDGIGDACDPNSYAPALGTAALDANGNEGDTLTASGSFTDQDGNDTLTITGTGVTDNGDGTWSWSLPTSDDVSGTVTVTASDGEHTSALDSFDYTAADVKPALSALNVSGNSGTACMAGNTVNLSFSFTGADVDTFSGSIVWGDGDTSSFTSSPVSTSHSYAAGTYTITVNVSDEDGTGWDDSDTANVSLLYSATGVLQPVNDTQAKQDPSVFKYGSTIPVKIRVTDCNSASVTGLAPQIFVKKTAGSTPPTGADETIASTSSADSGTTMRYDGVGGIYIYNLATKSLADSTATYQITIKGPFTDVTALFGTRAK